MNSKVTLSKSKLIEGLSCDKKVYFSVHKPDLKAPISAAKQQVFDQGTEIGKLAHNEYPNGVLIDSSLLNVLQVSFVIIFATVVFQPI